jgi:hypothetical protein
MKALRRVALAAGTAVLALTPASANHSWSDYHWARQTAGHLSLKVNTSVTSAWSSYVVTAVQDWDTPVKDQDNLTGPDILTLTRNPVTVNARKCNPITGQALVCNYAYGQRGWLGLASIWIDSSDHITRATTKLNDSYYKPGSSYDTPAWRAIVACQEIGHDFGLDHQDENFSNTNLGTCMDYTNDPTGTAGTNGTKANTKPNYHDYEELGIIYSHGDGYTTVTSAASTNFGIRQIGKPSPQEVQGAGDTMAEWGRAIHTDAKGRPDVFLRQVDGLKMLTHVFWALEATGAEAR